MHISAIQSLIFHNVTPRSVSMSHTQLQNRITKREAKKVERWSSMLGDCQRKRDFKNMLG